MGERKERRLRREAEAAAERDRIEQEKAAQEQPEAEEAQPEQAAVQEAAPEQQGEAETDHRENAPRRAPGEEAAPVRKRRRRAKINLQAAVVLLVFALLMGVVLGYVLGRSAGETRAKEAEAKLAELSVTIEPQQQAQLEQSAEQANEEALAALAGEQVSSDGDSSLLMGVEDLSGAADVQLTDEVVAEFGGGELMASEVIEEYNARLACYMFEGYSEEEVSETLLREVMEDMVFERVLEAHARELGVYELTAADEQQIAAEAQQRYEEQLSYARSLVRTGEMSDAEVEAAAQSYLLESEGVNQASIEAELRASWWMDKLYDALTANVSVGSGEIMTAYNEALADQKERFLASAEDYEAAQISGEVIVYNLPGYRRVKMVGLSFDSFDAMTAVDELNAQIAALDASADAEQIAELQAQIDAYYAPLEEKANELLQSMTDGGDMESLSSQYGGEMEEGCVCADSSLWTQEIIDAAMALAAPGDVSGIVRTGDGVYILQYVEDVPEGTVAMSEVYDALSAQTQETARYLAYETQINAWMEEADPKYYPERMQ
ncbi:MAG: hypothetical protein Q4G06_09440 [Clostridia bacterium]|nr:hypothetical protein [Clostridia bacterium]